MKSEGELPHSAPGGKRSSIKAVAAEAGVGLGTASRALTGRGYVDETTRQRVLRAAQKLGYRPNRLAAGLRSNRSHLIALMLPDLTNEFYAVSSQVIQTRLTEAGYQLLITTSKNGAEEQETIKSLSEYHIDGIIRVPVDPLQSVSASCPVIELNRRTVDPAGVGVVSDEDAGFFALTNELLARGHRRIAFIVGEEDFSTTQHRRAGFRRAMENAGPDVTPIEMCRAFSSEWGYEAATQLLTGENRPTAIIAASPRIASGVVRACTELGVKVPEELSLAGYSDPEWYEFWGGGIVSFVPPLAEMADTATDMLLRQLEDPTYVPSSVILPGWIREGGSVRLLSERTTAKPPTSDASPSPR